MAASGYMDFKKKIINFEIQSVMQSAYIHLVKKFRICWKTK